MKPIAVLVPFDSIPIGFNHILRNQNVCEYSTHRRELFTEHEWYIVVDRPEQLLAFEIKDYIVVGPQVPTELIQMAKERKR